MSIQGKHAYRFGYLKSEQWQNVRVEALARTDAHCQICGYRSISNDAHHVVYQSSFWDTRSNDLVILCRRCHVLIERIRTKLKNKGQCFAEFRIFKDALIEWIETAPYIPKVNPKREEFKKTRCFACHCTDKPLIDHKLTMVKEYTGNPSNHPWCDDCWRDFQFHQCLDWSDVRDFLDSRRS